MYIELNEVLVFVIVLAGYFFVVREFVKSSQNLFFFLAYSFLILGSLFSIVEGFFFEYEFNLLEHVVGKALAGVFFAVSLYLSYIKVVSIQDQVSDSSRRKK